MQAFFVCFLSFDSMQGDGFEYIAKHACIAIGYFKHLWLYDTKGAFSGSMQS